MEYVLLIYILLFCFTSDIIAKNKKVVRFDRYDVCRVAPNSTFKFNRIEIVQINHGSVINSDMDVLVDTPAISMLTKITRCINKEQLDSCEKYFNLDMKNACVFLKKKGLLSSPMIYSMAPPFICPFKKGHYIQRNGTFDPNLIQIIPMEGYYWKYETEYYNHENNAYMFSHCVELTVVSVPK